MTLCLLVVITLLIAQLLDDIFRIDQILICMPEDDSMLEFEDGMPTWDRNHRMQLRSEHLDPTSHFASLVSLSYFQASLPGPGFSLLFPGPMGSLASKTFLYFQQTFLEKDQDFINILLIFM